MLTVYSDLNCPWAYLFSIRLRRTLERQARPAQVQWRSWPLELVNERGTPWSIVSSEIPVVAQLEPAHFSAPDRDSWPSTLLPAMEAVKVADAVGGSAAADRYDAAARRAFFLDKRDLSLRSTLIELAGETGLDRERFRAELDGGGQRRAVIADWHDGRERGVQGSPHVLLPDGSDVFNPGIGSVDFSRGIPIIKEVDQSIIEQLARAAVEREA